MKHYWLLFLLTSCSSTRITYEVGGEINPATLPSNIGSVSLASEVKKIEKDKKVEPTERKRGRGLIGKYGDTYSMWEALFAEQEEPVKEKPIQPAVLPKVSYLESQRVTVEDSPDQFIPKRYRVKIDNLRVRDYPSMTEGKVIGILMRGDEVVGYDVEGPWIRIFENSYTGISFLEPMDN